jgi:cytochrome c biogenesis protein
VVLQDLPFDVELKKFIVEYYDTGMPKLFASEIVIHDRDTEKATRPRSRSTSPVVPPRRAIYQSSFDDGGSLAEAARPAAGAGRPSLRGAGHGGRHHLATAGWQRSKPAAGIHRPAGDQRREPRQSAARRQGERHRRAQGRPGPATLSKHLGSGARPAATSTLRNIGPSVTYKLRDAAGQAREFHNYMLPVELDGQRVFLAGVRDTPERAFRYLRIPADEQGSLDGWLRLRTALERPKLRDQAARRYATLGPPADKPEMASSCSDGPCGAGAVCRRRPHRGGQRPRPCAGGLQALSQLHRGQRARGRAQRASPRCCCASSTGPVRAVPT